MILHMLRTTYHHEIRKPKESCDKPLVESRSWLGNLLNKFKKPHN